MLGHLRISSPQKQLGVLFLVFSPQLFLLIVGLFMNNDLGASQKIDTSNIQQIKWSQALSSVLFFFLPAYFFSLFTFKGRHFYFLGLKKAQQLNNYIFAVLGILFMLPLVFYLGQLNSGVNLPDWMRKLESSTGNQLEAILKVNSKWDIFVNLFIIAFLPAVCEELFFRGALQRVLIHYFKNPWVGIITASFIFSTLHLQFAGFLPRFFLGILLGFFYWYSGSLWPSIAAHFANNALQVLVISFYPEYVKANPNMPETMLIAASLGGAALLYQYYKQSKVTYESVYEPEKLHEKSEFIA